MTDTGDRGLGSTALLQRADFPALIDVLADRGYRILGPRVRDGAVTYEDVRGVEDLPIGVRDTQDGGRYKLESSGDAALFGYTNGVQSWRRYLFPPRRRLWAANVADDGFEIVAETAEAPKVALLGVRPCEIHAIQIQDRVFLGGDYPDSDYAARRAKVFIIAVNCVRAADTCFCASMGTGPRAADGFDLALTEVIDNERHVFLVEIGSVVGADIARALPLHPASDADASRAAEIRERTAANMRRWLATKGLKEVLQGNPQHPRWREVAERCLACGNCTLVCPTCFCFAVEHVTDVAGVAAECVRRWDSCFTLGHSYIHGGSVRREISSRYRQWMTHKLAHWIDQYGVSGCVGCGRCIIWCPVGIDITEEAAAIRADDRRP